RRARDRLDPAGVPGSGRHLQRTPFAPRPFILRGLLPPSPNASLARQGLSALASHPVTAERPSRRHTEGRRVTPSLSASRGLTASTTFCHCLRGGRCRTACESSY